MESIPELCICIYTRIWRARARAQNSEYIFGGREHNFQTVWRKHAAGDVQISQDERPLIPKFSKGVGGGAARGILLRDGGGGKVPIRC